MPTIRNRGLVLLCLAVILPGWAGAQEYEGWTGGAPRPLLSPSSDALAQTQASDASTDESSSEAWSPGDSGGFAGNLDDLFSHEELDAQDEPWPSPDLQTQDTPDVLTTGLPYPTTAPSTDQPAEPDPRTSPAGAATTRTSFPVQARTPGSGGRVTSGRGGVFVAGSSGGAGGSGAGQANFSLGSSGGGSASAASGGGGGAGARPGGKIVTAGSSTGSVNVVTSGSSGAVTHGQSSGSASIVTGNAPVVNDPTAIDRGRNEHTDEPENPSPGSNQSNAGSTHGGVVGAYPTTPDLLTPYRPTPGRLVAWMTIAWSGNNPAERNISRGLRIYDQGWAGYIRGVLDPQLKLGVRRFVLHNPFGAVAGEVMQLDQLLQARAAGLAWLERDFVSAWKAEIQKHADAGDPIEVIAYFGTPRASENFVKLDQAGDRAAWLKRAWDSVQPAVDAGMSVALDMATGTTRDHPNYEFVQQLKARGVRVYLEGIPPKQSPWLNDNIIMFNTALDDMPSQVWACDPREIRGELMLVLKPPAGESWSDQKWVYPLARKYLTEHDVTVATSVAGIVASGRRLDDLFDAVARARSSAKRPIAQLQ